MAGQRDLSYLKAMVNADQTNWLLRQNQEKHYGHGQDHFKRNR
jgi:hypothetical protein